MVVDRGAGDLWRHVSARKATDLVVWWINGIRRMRSIRLLPAAVHLITCFGRTGSKWWDRLAPVSSSDRHFGALARRIAGRSLGW